MVDTVWRLLFSNLQRKYNENDGHKKVPTKKKKKNRFWLNFAVYGSTEKSFNFFISFFEIFLSLCCDTHEHTAHTNTHTYNHCSYYLVKAPAALFSLCIMIYRIFGSSDTVAMIVCCSSIFFCFCIANGQNMARNETARKTITKTK